MIRFENVCKDFDGRPVLVDLNWEVPDGTTWRITGPNGSGKSTCLKMVLGLAKPDSGRLQGITDRAVSAVFQEDRLCPGMSAIGNLRLVAPGMTREAAAEALVRLGLPEAAMTDPVRLLSGGQRRRVALARALSVPAEIVCLDEPFTGIDADSLPDVIATLLAGLAAKTVLLVTHDDALAAEFNPAVLPLAPRR